MSCVVDIAVLLGRLQIKLREKDLSLYKLVVLEGDLQTMMELLQQLADDTGAVILRRRLVREMRFIRETKQSFMRSRVLRALDRL